MWQLAGGGGPSQINLAHKSSQHQRIFTAAQKLIFTSADKRNITQATQYTKYTGPTWLFSCCFLLPDKMLGVENVENCWLEC